MNPISTRLQTRLTGRYVRATSGSQSLERGLSLLRAFRMGTSVLTNAELADRTKLARPTVSRLARSLVDSGFLVYDHDALGYRIGPVFLSLSLNFRASNQFMQAAIPLMRETAEKHQVNVGLAMLDHTEMVYLESVRLNRRGISREVGAGTRIPVIPTALGRAYLSAMPAVDRQNLMCLLQSEDATNWTEKQRQIEAAYADMRMQDYCWAQWQQRIISIATVVNGLSGENYSLNISFTKKDSEFSRIIPVYGDLLLLLKQKIINAQIE